MNHQYLGDICLDPRSFELVLLPLRQQVRDGVLQLLMISMVVGGDHLPCSVSYCILVCGSKSWTLVTAEHIRSTEDLYDYLVLFSSRAWNSFDSELWQSGDVEAVQQIPQSVGGDRRFISGSLDLVAIMVCLILLIVTQRSVIFIIFTFSLVALFFFLLIVFFFLMNVVVVVVLRQLLSFLRVFSRRYRDHDLKGVLLLRNVLRRVGLRLWQWW
jgi:hypothetical protein